MDTVQLQTVLSLCNFLFIVQFNLHGNESLSCFLCCVRWMQYENTTVESPISRIHPENVNHNVAIVQYIHILKEGASYLNNSDGMSPKTTDCL